MLEKAEDDKSTPVIFPKGIECCGVQLTAMREAAAICSLKLSDNAEAEEIQRQVAISLFLIYLQGGNIANEEIAANEEKAEIYLAQACWALPPDSCWAGPLHVYLSWLTSWRLAALRVNRACLTVSQLTHHQSFVLSNPIINSLRIGGLSYWLEFILGVGHIIYWSFRPESLQEENLNYGRRFLKLWGRFEWKRFKNLCSEFDFLRSMSNALLWGSLNTVCLLWVGVMWSSIINLIGFAIDVIHDSGFAYIKWKNDSALLLKFLSLPSNQADSTLNVMTSKLLLRERQAKSKLITAVVSSGGIVLGMGLFWFPPVIVLNLLLWKGIGAAVTVVCGVLYGGLGDRLYNHDYKATLQWVWKLACTIAGSALDCAKALCYCLYACFEPGPAKTLQKQQVEFQQTSTTIKEHCGEAQLTTQLVSMLKKLNQNVKQHCQTELKLSNEAWSNHALRFFKRQAREARQSARGELTSSSQGVIEEKRQTLSRAG